MSEIVSNYSPYGSRKKSPIYLMLYRSFGGPEVPNKSKTTEGRALDAYRELKNSLHFFAGVMTMVPLMHSRRRVQFQHDGEKLMLDASDFARKSPVTVGAIRKMRVFNEKIVKLTEKIKKDLAAN